MNIPLLMFCILCHLPFSLVGYCDPIFFQKTKVDPDFMYLGLQIPDDYLGFFFTDSLFWGSAGDVLDLTACFRDPGYLERAILSNRNFWMRIKHDENPIYREWKHLGTLPGGFQVVLAKRHESGSTGYFDGIMIVQRRENELILNHIICVGDRWNGGIGCCTIEKGKICYSQNVNSECLMNRLMSLFPDLKQQYEVSPKREICGGQCGEGSFKYEVLISPQGTIEKSTLLSFTPCEGTVTSLSEYSSDQELRQYLLEEFIDVSY